MILGRAAAALLRLRSPASAATVGQRHFRGFATDCVASIGSAAPFATLMGEPTSVAVDENRKLWAILSQRAELEEAKPGTPASEANGKKKKKRDHVGRKVCIASSVQTGTW